MRLQPFMQAMPNILPQVFSDWKQVYEDAQLAARLNPSSFAMKWFGFTHARSRHLGDVEHAASSARTIRLVLRAC